MEKRHAAKRHGMEDAEIVSRVLGGEIDLFETLVLRHQAKVFRLVSRRIPAQAVEEVAHEVFIRAYRSLATYGRKRPFSTWLTGVTVRACAEFWRRRSRNPEIPLSALAKPERWEMKTAICENSLAAHRRQTWRQEAAEAIQRAFLDLPPEERSLLMLLYFEGYTLREAAGLLGWSLPKTKIRAYRARRRLRRLLKTGT